MLHFELTFDSRASAGHRAVYGGFAEAPEEVGRPPEDCIGYRREDRPSDRWSAIYRGWAFLVRTRDRIAPMATQSSDGRLRRGRRSFGYRPCLVRMAVGARAHLGSRRRVSFWSLLRAPRR